MNEIVSWRLVFQLRVADELERIWPVIHRNLLHWDAIPVGALQVGRRRFGLNAHGPVGVPSLSVRDEHVKVDMFLNMMPAAPRRFFAISNDVLMVLFGAMFAYAGWLFLQRASRFSTPALGMPNLIWYLPAIVGMLLMLLVAIDRAAAAIASGGKDEAAS